MKWPNAVRNGAAIVLAAAGIWLVLGELDRPGHEPVARWEGTVKGISVAALGNGAAEDHVQIVLSDGRRVTATSLRNATELAMPPRVPPRLDFGMQRVRVDEYRRVILGRLRCRRFAGAVGQSQLHDPREGMERKRRPQAPFFPASASAQAATRTSPIAIAMRSTHFLMFSVDVAKERRRQPSAPNAEPGTAATACGWASR
jgi:hypothetical protein